MRAPHVTELTGVDAIVYGLPFDTATSYRSGPPFGPEATGSGEAGMRGSLYGAEAIEVARERGFTVLSSDELRDLGAARYGELVRERVGERPVFMSFDIDFLDPAFAPGTGTPEVGGFSTAEAVGFLRALRGVKLAGCDVVEVAPQYDGAGQQTALAAANVAWELLALRALGGAP